MCTRKSIKIVFLYRISNVIFYYVTARDDWVLFFETPWSRPWGEGIHYSIPRDIRRREFEFRRRIADTTGIFSIIKWFPLKPLKWQTQLSSIIIGWGTVQSRPFQSRQFSPRQFSPKNFSPENFSPKKFSPKKFSPI